MKKTHMPEKMSDSDKRFEDDWLFKHGSLQKEQKKADSKLFLGVLLLFVILLASIPDNWWQRYFE